MQSQITELETEHAVSDEWCGQVHRTRWGADPLARGSYSYPRAGACNSRDCQALAEPLLAKKDGHSVPTGTA